ncbi:EamA family transporter [Quadrisphaera granulorum]|uniref:EamA family transporter n=1 Tax=Quadrisphaera granulorum TaxID=317664 RepID=UPI001B85CF8A|nr:EamA family transporter [Quadrisphaera granulorum]
MSTSQERRHAAGVALALAASVSNQSGASAGALAMGALGAPGVVAVRQVVAALALNAVARPAWRSLDRRTWLLVVALAAVMGTMNLTLFAAIDRIGLGLAVTLEFLGPLSVAVGTSRRVVDCLAALVAAVGVVVLVRPGPASDIVGIAAALVAAAMWASYILLNRALGPRLPGLGGATAATTVLALTWSLPVVVVTLFAGPSWQAVTLAVVCGVLSSAVPYAADLSALRMLPASLFSTLASANPVWAFAVGALVLGQRVEGHEVIGAVLVVVANIVATLRWPRSGPPTP